MTRKVLLVDGHHALHRVCFIPELQKLRSSKGAPTGPVFGFLRVLRATLNRFKADSCIVCWDMPASMGMVGRRNKIYPEYKANRADKPKPEALEHLGDQLGMLFGLLPYLNVKQMAVPGYEGDDLLYLLTTLLPLKDNDVTVVSEDKDLLQLVTKGVAVYRPIADQLVNYNNFEEMTGTHPEAFVLRKAIVGDTSDNIKGVMGVGEKTADKLLREAYFDEGEEWEHDYLMKGYYDPLITLCEDHRTKTARKVSDQWETVERNIELMDLSKNEFEPELFDRARALLEMKANLNFTDVELIQELGRYEFDEITKRFVTWIKPFRMLK